MFVIVVFRLCGRPISFWTVAPEAFVI